jgi:hypothetical protein
MTGESESVPPLLPRGTPAAPDRTAEPDRAVAPIRPVAPLPYAAPGVAVGGDRPTHLPAGAAALGRSGLAFGILLLTCLVVSGYMTLTSPQTMRLLRSDALLSAWAVGGSLLRLAWAPP